MNINIGEFYERVLDVTDPVLVQKLVSMTELRSVEKKEVLIQEGQPASYIPFILSGIFRGFFLDVNGRDITDCFGFQCGDPVMASFSLDAAATVTIEALTDSMILCLPMDEVSRLLSESAYAVQVYNRFLVGALQRHWEIKNALHKQTARERYQWFLTAYPGLIDQVTHRYIASFLEMSPVTLSRLRSEDRGRCQNGI